MKIVPWMIPINVDQAFTVDIEDFNPKKDANELLAYLFDHQNKLSEKMNICIDGCIYSFKSRNERIIWAQGFQKAFDLFWEIIEK